MLHIVTGPFHRVLDRALVENIRSLKSGNPFDQVAVVVPSSALAEHLKWMLAVESQLSLLNVQVLTFHQFALRLRDDLARGGSEKTPWQLVDDFYFEQLVRVLVRRRLPALKPLANLPPASGTWRGLWATIRDLKDAGVNPATMYTALDEGVFEAEDRPWLGAISTLHAAILEAGQSLGIGSPDDLAVSLTPRCSESPFLAGLKAILYYGFYDLSQVQLSFFEAITRCANTSLYFPLTMHSAFSFARRFFDRHLLPLASTHEDRNIKPIEPGPASKVELLVTNVVGAEEELAAACREIVRLVEIHNYRHDEIGVVARSLEPYQARLQAVFDRHLVPFSSTGSRPLMREPLVKALLRLASLPVNDFERSAVLDVLASPWYRIQRDGDLGFAPRPDLWRIMASNLGITKGQPEWDRLSDAAASSILIEPSDLQAEEETTRVAADDPGQLRLFSILVTNLIRGCDALPRQGSIVELTQAFRSVIQSHMSIPGGIREATPATPTEPHIYEIASLVERTLERLLEFEPLGVELSWKEWTEWFRLALEETELPIEGGGHRGVQVLDAMTARGLRFRALFIIGLNDQMFPRVIREDPFLRDRHRLVLGSTLGFKIDEKLAGHDEERLLFELLSQAATHRLYFSYQRADEEGRTMTPSAFVNAAIKDVRFTVLPELAIPRQLTSRVTAQPTIQEALPAQELAVIHLIQGHDAGLVLERTGQDGKLFDQGRSVQLAMERESSDLGPHDGMIRSISEGGTASDQTSMSPTSLERYGTCPFQYFAENVLRLEPVRALPNDHLPAVTLGTLMHSMLRLSYERLIVLNWPESELQKDKLRKLIIEGAREVFEHHAAAQGTGHALLWKLAEEKLIDLVYAAALADQVEYRKSAFRPKAFEVEANGFIELASNGVGLKVHGKLDRIDVRSDPPGLRIVDYKLKQGAVQKTEDRNLLLAAIRGFRLQPPLYASMRVPSLPEPEEVQFVYLAPRWENQISRSAFSCSVLSTQSGELIKQTLRTLIQGIERGEFFILPDGYCDYCEFSSACRRHHTTTWWRSYRSPEAQRLRRLRKQKVTDD